MKISDRALDIISEISGRDRSQLEPHMELVTHLGFDSAKALELLVELEDRLGIILEDDDIASLTNIAEILAAVERVGPATG